MPRCTGYGAGHQSNRSGIPLGELSFLQTDGRRYQSMSSVERGTVCRLPSSPTPTDGGPERRVVKDLSSSDWGNGNVTAERLYFIRRTDDGPRIVFRGVGSGETRTVASIPNIASPSLEVSPDGERVLYARIEGTNSDLIAAPGTGQP